ncbi:MAG: PIN domain-containing protein [Candidatus Electrothrix sp. AUS1_2]|nr:PIN domain-containing protein [Candidatus Electrothrix sp. AUS1_2]
MPVVSALLRLSEVFGGLVRKIVLDTSVVIALLASEEERIPILEKVRGAQLVCSDSIVPEVGNAVSAMFKRQRITLEQGAVMVEGFRRLPLSFVSYDLIRAVELCHIHNIYAYDAYVLECAERLHLPLMTLDNRMAEVAHTLTIPIVEV